MAAVKLEKVNKIYAGSVYAAKDINLDVQDHEFLVLVGPSGCGKTTVLRLIAGLEDPSGGEIYIAGRRVNGVSPKDRDIAMVFQNYALYPHMNVYENMGFGLKLHGLPKAQIENRIVAASQLLKIQELLKRKPSELSGGQRQRVAMGRAIVREPRVFLMDEPLSNLDAQLRATMRTELQKLHRQLGVTTIYVTHDQVEAMTLGSRLAVMKNGILQQIDSPLNLYNFPINLFVASFIGSPSMNFISMNVIEKNGDLFFAAGSLEIKVPPEKKQVINSIDIREVVFGIRPESVDVTTELSTNPDKALIGIVEARELIGSDAYLHITLGAQSIIAKTKSESSSSLGTKLCAVLDMNKIHLFDPKTTLAIR